MGLFDAAAPLQKRKRNQGVAIFPSRAGCAGRSATRPREAYIGRTPSSILLHFAIYTSSISRWGALAEHEFKLPANAPAVPVWVRRLPGTGKTFTSVQSLAMRADARFSSPADHEHGTLAGLGVRGTDDDGCREHGAHDLGWNVSAAKSSLLVTTVDQMEHVTDEAEKLARKH